MGGDHGGGSSWVYNDRTSPWMAPSALMPVSRSLLNCTRHNTFPFITGKSKSKLVREDRVEEEVEGRKSHGGEAHVDMATLSVFEVIGGLLK